MRTLSAESLKDIRESYRKEGIDALVKLLQDDISDDKAKLIKATNLHEPQGLSEFHKRQGSLTALESFVKILTNL